MPPFTDPIDIVEEPIEPKEKIENPKTDDREHSNKELKIKIVRAKILKKKNQMKNHLKKNQWTFKIYQEH